MFSEKLLFTIIWNLTDIQILFRKQLLYIYVSICTIVDNVVVVVVVVWSVCVLEIYIVDYFEERRQIERTETLKYLYNLSTCLTQHKHFIDN